MKILRIIALTALFQVLGGTVAAGAHLVLFHSGQTAENTAVTTEPTDGSKIHNPCAGCDVRFKTTADVEGIRTDDIHQVSSRVQSPTSDHPTVTLDLTLPDLRGPPLS